MKKLISMVLSLVMVAAMAVCAVPVMADDVLSPTATTAQSKKPILEVNGSGTDTDITYTVDPTNPNKVTFEYNGDGTLVGWENNLTDELGFVEGTDYEAVFNEDGTYTITFISEDAIAAWNNGTVKVNALVEYDEEDTTKASTTKKNGSNKSPSTGAPTSAIAATVAVAGAGFAVLAATKKRDAE